jgi:ribonuclease HI
MLRRLVCPKDTSKEKYIRLTLRWVKGHADNVGNKISDLVANETYKAYQQGLT